MLAQGNTQPMVALCPANPNGTLMIQTEANRTIYLGWHFKALVEPGWYLWEHYLPGMIP